MRSYLSNDRLQCAFQTESSGSHSRGTEEARLTITDHLLGVICLFSFGAILHRTPDPLRQTLIRERSS
jgi:hypothetical protein